jgi:hypothetical protein
MLRRFPVRCAGAADPKAAFKAALVVFGQHAKVKILYLDEAGDLQSLPAVPGPNDQPVFILGGVCVDYVRLETLTLDFLQLKRRFFPGLGYRSGLYLDAVLAEIKGADLRRNAASTSRNQQRQVFGFLDNVFDLLETNNVSITARIWVKPLGRNMRSTSVYTSSIQRLYQVYDHLLTTDQDYGVCLIDSRTKGLNVPVAHSIFTQKFKTHSEYPRIVELPGFVHSDNHVGIQLSDLLCSAILYPITTYVYCTGHIQNVHVNARHADLQSRYGRRLKALQYRYVDTLGRGRGGLTVSDGIGARTSALLFR